MAVHVAITRRVKPGREREFEDRLRTFFQTSLTHAGVLGALLLTPGPGSNSREYGILRSFGTAAERDAFYNSAMFQDWLAESRDLTEAEPVQRDLHGLEAWFRSPRSPSPPRWKMAFLTWLAVWPASFLSGATLGAVAPGLSRWQSSAIVAAAVVLMLTWAVMPALTRVARRWLVGEVGTG
ncbi:MAG: antibiotic biosynthesis monooxygenase [Lentisphaerae bacterium]|nr:antibiotic biosynthesis monooxygenase [Lentisphaerota bacterium]